MTTNDYMQPATHHLRSLGFTEYEAQAYVTLVEHGELSGYELAKRSGIPRANVYAVAGKLLGRGAVLQSHGDKHQRYVAVAPTVLLRGIDAGRQRTLAAAEEALAALAQPDHSAAVFTLQGEQLLDRTRQLIDACNERLLIAIQPPEAKQLAPVLQHAQERGVAIVTLCLEACEQPCAGCQGQLHRHALAPVDGSRWLLLVTDGNEALVGRITATLSEGMAAAQPLVIELVAAYIHQSLALATLGSELAGRFDGLLSEQARQMLYPKGVVPTSADS